MSLLSAFIIAHNISGVTVMQYAPRSRWIVLRNVSEITYVDRCVCEDKGFR